MRIKTFKKLHIEIPEIHDQMLEEIQNKKGFLTTAEAARYCFFTTHKAEFPDYIRAQRERYDNKETPEERATRIVEQEELRESTKKNKEVSKKAQICDTLGGTIDDINGEPYCKYKMYAEVPGKKVESVPMSEPLSMLSENAIDHQYRDIMGRTGEEVKTRLLAL